MVNSSVVKRIGRNPFNPFAFGCTILNQPSMKLAGGQFKTRLKFIGADVEVCTAEVMPLVLKRDSELPNGTNFHILDLGEFNSTSEPISEEFDVLLILFVHR